MRMRRKNLPGKTKVSLLEKYNQPRG